MTHTTKLTVSAHKSARSVPYRLLSGTLPVQIKSTYLKLIRLVLSLEGHQICLSNERPVFTDPTTPNWVGASRPTNATGQISAIYLSRFKLAI